MKNTIIDNSNEDLSMTKVLSELWADPHINEVKIATGYWDLKAVAKLYDVIKPFLDREDTHLNILIGKDPYVYESMLKNKNKYKDCQSTGDFIRVDINELELNDGFVHTAKLFLDYADGDSPKIQIRLYDKDENGNKQFLHSKCYIFKGADDSYGIIGSSNFTENGLMNNAELNYLETDSTRVMAVPQKGSNQKGHDYWFDQMWNKAEDWTKEFLVQILRKSKVGTKAAQPQQPVVADNPELTPYEVYIKYLQTQFGDIADNATAAKGFVPQIDSFRQLQYQTDAVEQGYSIIKKHNGFILADVVGLGKTMVGLMLARKFLFDTEKGNRPNDILIVAPPAIIPSWKDTVQLFDTDGLCPLKDHITFVTTGSVETLAESNEADVDGEIVTEKQNFGLIIVDESHRFRNSSTLMYQSLDEIIDNCYPQPYMALLSATPQNNAPDDLKNQIYLFQREHKNSTLEGIEGGKIDEYFTRIQKKFDDAKKAGNYKVIKQISEDMRNNVLSQLLVRRTRADIKKFYAADSADLHFPEIKGPEILEYKFNGTLARLFADTMDVIAPRDSKGNFVFNQHGLYYYRYRAIEYFASDDLKNLYIRQSKKKKKNDADKIKKTVEQMTNQLARIMQINLVKRLESSFSAFKQSLANLEQNTENMIRMWQDNRIFICPDIDVNAELNIEKKSKNRNRKVTIEECYSDIAKKIAKHISEHRPNAIRNAEYTRDNFTNNYIDLLKTEKAKIADLRKRWDEIKFDPKLKEFINNLEYRLFDETDNHPQKLVIFTEAKDTQKELKESISQIVRFNGRILAIDADNRDDMRSVIKANFDANTPKEEQKNDFDIIITTDVLAEGINLHRANVILNYDTPWNSTRLMQRIGRVNRIGSEEDSVLVFNFMPSANGDKEIGLVNKAHSKLQAFHSTFGEDSQIFTEMEEVHSFGTDPESFRNLVDGGVSPMEEYMAELRDYKKQNPNRYEYIKSLDKGIETAVNGSDNSVLLYLRNQNGGFGLSVTYQNGNYTENNIMQTIKMLQCKPGTAAVGFNEPTDEIIEGAVTFYNDFYNRVSGRRSNDKAIKEVNKYIDTLLKDTSISKENQKLLKRVRRLITDNHDMQLIRKMKRLYFNILDIQNGLFPLENNDLNLYLQKQLDMVKDDSNSGTIFNPYPVIYYETVK